MTNADILSNAPIACTLAGNDIANGSLYGKRIDPTIPTKIYVTYKIIKKIFDLDNNYAGMTAACLYLFELMGRWGVLAQYYTSGGGSVSPVTPNAGTYLIPITGADFTDATHYDNTKIVGKALVIFWNDANRYLLSSEFEATATGINVLIAGFDAVTNPSYELFIYIVNP